MADFPNYSENDSPFRPVLPAAEPDEDHTYEYEGEVEGFGFEVALLENEYSAGERDED